MSSETLVANEQAIFIYYITMQCRLVDSKNDWNIWNGHNGPWGAVF